MTEVAWDREPTLCSHCANLDWTTPVCKVAGSLFHQRMYSSKNQLCLFAFLYFRINYWCKCKSIAHKTLYDHRNTISQQHRNLQDTVISDLHLGPGVMEKNTRGAVYWCYKRAPSFVKLSRADLKSYPGQANTLFLTLILLKNECDISDDPYWFQFSLNYLERIRCYGPDKRKLMDEWMETIP